MRILSGKTVLLHEDTVKIVDAYRGLIPRASIVNAALKYMVTHVPISELRDDGNV